MPSDATPVTCTRHLRAVCDLGLCAVCLVAVRRLQPVLLLLRNRRDNIYGATVMAQPLPEFTRFIR